MKRTTLWQAFLALGWSRVERGCAVLAMLLFALSWFLAGARYALARPDRERLIDVALVEAQLPVLALFLAGALLLLLCGLYLRRRRPDSLAFQYLAAAYYGLPLLWTGYLIGTLSFTAGVVLMGSGLTGYILLERQVIRVCFLVNFALLLALNLAASAGLVPYAPALHSPQHSADALFWTHASFYLGAPHLFSCILAVALMLGRWQRREQLILRLGLTDALTGVPNRRSILERLQAERSAAPAAGAPLAVVLLDLDHFKAINDRFGHPAGDRVLRAAAACLQACLGPAGTVGRFGGEEFLLLLPGQSPAATEALVERCRVALQALAVTGDGGEPIPVSASFGVAWCAQPAAVPAEALVQAADGELYAVKAAGRNGWRLTEVAAREAGSTPATGPSPALLRGADKLPPRRRYLRLLRQFLGGWPHWTPVDKQMFHLGLSIALFGNFMVWGLFVRWYADGARFVQLELFTPLMLLMLGINVGYVLLIGLGVLVRRRHPDSWLYQVVSQQYFAITLVLLGHYIGILSFATGVMLVGLPLVGFTYFRQRLVWWSVATAMAGIVATAYACALGWLPYAPVLAADGDRHQPHSLFWVASYYYFIGAAMVVILVLADQTFGRWRQRGQQVLALARTDALTRVHNRRSILALLDKEMARCQHRGPALAVVLLDLDHFKRINDRYGHPTGDRVLQAAARVLQEQLRETDAVGRFGGEEFLLLLPATPLEGAAALVERCRAALAATTVAADSGETVAISASFGVASNQHCLELGAEALVKVADDALYRAKAAGRNRVEATAPAVHPVQPAL